jgi:small-conductance mechanosensitive channel
VDWYRQLIALGQSSGLADDEVDRDRLRQSSIAAVQFAFDFSNAAASVLGPAGAVAGSAPPDSSDDAARMARTAARLAARASALQSRVKELDTEIASAPARIRDSLTTRRAQVQASLDLTLEVQKTVVQLQQFAARSTSAGGGAASLATQIADLQRTVPETRSASSASRETAGRGGTADTGASVSVPPPASNASVSSTVAIRPSSAGLIPLASEWFSLRATRRQVDDAIKTTDKLSDELDSLRRAVGRQVGTLVRTSMADTLSTGTGAGGAAQRQTETATAQFRKLSTVLVPLSEQDITMDDARGTLSALSTTFSERSLAVARNIAFRAAVLALCIALVLLISEFWRRATFKYLHDTRRRRQFLLLRRVAVAIALLVILFLGFVSEIGSLATYVGFLTAGVAVALQNVILAVVAYFFLIGRYGVRLGDRITLAGVTGRVVEIGLIRLYVMELSGPELQPTGRIVVLSNAVLFKPEALFKQIPGAEYVWHSVTLTLAPTTDVRAVQERLQAAAESVYGTYKETIDAQHAAVQRLVDFETTSPEPRVDVRYTDTGFEFTVRYPVLPDRAAANDQLMVKTLHDAVAQESQVTMNSPQDTTAE